MASIKNLEMAAALSAYQHINIKKSLFGQKAIYTPTGSPIEVHVVEYTPTEGEQLSRLLHLPMERLAAELQTKGTPRPTAVGQYRLEACVSKDQQFAAMQLFRFVDFRYSPASDFITAEGSDVATLASLLSAQS